ncbi:MAG: EAL domain-containing protein [Pseudomonadota bacterium]
MKAPSLKTTLALLILPLFLLMGAVLYGVGLHHTRAFLQNQMATHAQDGATALALRAGPYLAEDDRAAVANVVDALFDSGYYQEIALVRPDGHVILSRSASRSVVQAPAWFVALLPMAAPVAEAEASAGWRALARVRVASHPGQAYGQLWGTARDSLIWTGGFALAGIILLVLVIARALRPLGEMETLALDVAKGHFPRLARRSRVRELGHIADALDHMSASVERMLDEKSRLVERLRADLLTDAATGLANRAYFESALAHASRPGAGYCGVLLVQVTGLAAWNARQGRAAGDQLLAAVARALAGEVGPQGGLAARLEGAQFGLVSESCAPEALLQLAERLARAVDGALAQRQALPDCAVHVGLTCEAGADRSQLLAHADAALRDALQGPSGSVRQATAPAPGRESLHQLLLAAVADEALGLAWQRVVGCRDGALMHMEAFARLQGPEGHSLPAGAFIGLAESAGLVARLDKQIITRVWQAAESGPEIVRAVNVSGACLALADFIPWLSELVTEPGRLCLEYTLGRGGNDALALETLAALKALGFAVVLDRCMPNTRTLEQMAVLVPDWIKVEGGVCRHAEAHPGTRSLLSALCEYAHGLGIRVAATGVETPALARIMCDLGIDALQGWVNEGGHSPVTGPD